MAHARKWTAEQQRNAELYGVCDVHPGIPLEVRLFVDPAAPPSEHEFLVCRDCVASGSMPIPSNR